MKQRFVIIKKTIDKINLQSGVVPLTQYYAGESNHEKNEDKVVIATDDIDQAKHYDTYDQAIADIKYMFENYESVRVFSFQIEKIFLYEAIS